MMEEENLLEQALARFLRRPMFQPGYCEDLTITPLKRSLLNGSIDKIQEILCKDYDVEIKFENTDWEHKCQEIVDICIHREINVNLENKYSTLLHFVAENLYEDFNSVLIRCKDFDINAFNISLTYLKDPIPLIHFAIKNGRTNVVKSLLEFDANVNIQGRYLKFTPLFYAIFTAQLEIAKMLLKAGANANARDDLGRKPVHVAFGQKENDRSLNYVKKLPRWEIIKLLCAYTDDLEFNTFRGTHSLCV